MKKIILSLFPFTLKGGAVHKQLASGDKDLLFKTITKKNKMNLSNYKQFFLGLVLGIIIGFIIFVNTNISQRYQLNNDGKIKIDTWTGKTWIMRVKDYEFYWKEF